MNKTRSYLLDSNEFEYTYIEPRVEPKTWRHWYRWVRKQYNPLDRVYLVKTTRLTLKGANRELKKYWTKSEIQKILDTKSEIQKILDNPSWLREYLEKKKPPNKGA